MANKTPKVPKREIVRIRIRDDDYSKAGQCVVDGGRSTLTDFVLDRAKRCRKWPKGMSVTNVVIRAGCVVAVLE